MASQFGLSQIIKEATHILDTSSSCIDLIFTTKLNLVVESGVHPSLHPDCHHQIAFAKFNLQIYYPPPYPPEIWHYKQANTELIRRAITDFNWDRAFLNTNVNEKVSIFSSTILNILSNFIPHETIVCDDKDPPWFNRAIRSLTQEKDTFNKYRKSKNNNQLLQHLRLLQEKLNSFISVSKQNYYSRMSTKLTKFHKSSKAYWSLLKTFSNNKKITLILSLYPILSLTLIKAVFHLVTAFGEVSKPVPKKLKNKFFFQDRFYPFIYFLQGSCILLHISHILSNLNSC